MTQEKFCELFAQLDNEDKIRCFNEYAMEHDCDSEIFDFDDNFFNEFFMDRPAEAVRACFFGNIFNYTDEYIRFNGYGNLVSMSESEAIEWAEDHADSIYNYPEIWSSYIEEEDEDEGEE